MYWLAFPLWVLAITGSPLATGAAFVLQLLPQFLLSPLTGMLADRWNPKRMMVAADLLRGSLVGVLAAVGAELGIWLAYAVTAGLSILSSCFVPGQAALIRRIMDRERIPSANSLLQASNSASLLLGPIAGGAAAGIFGYSTVFAANAASFFVSALATALVRAGANEESEAEGTAERFSLGSTPVRIYRVMQDPILGVVLAAAIVVNLLVGANPVLFLAHFYEVGLSPTVIGMIVSAEAVGLLAASFAMSALARTVAGLWKAMLAGALFEGVAMVVTVASVPDRMVLAYAALAVAGGSMLAFMVASRSLLQMTVSAARVGGVTGLWVSLSTGATLVAMLANTGISQLLSPRETLVILGSVLAVVAACVLFVSGRYVSRHLDQHAQDHGSHPGVT